MQGDLVNLNTKAFNKHCSGSMVKCLENLHYAYSSCYSKKLTTQSSLCQLVVDTH